MTTLAENLYRKITDCETTSETVDGKVAREAPANFFRLLIARAGSKIGDRLASPKTTLTWVLQALGAPPVFGGLVVPLRESGALLPQIFLGNYLKRFSVRKRAWVFGAIIQGLAIAGCGLVVMYLQGLAAGVAVTALVALFSLARAISSVAAKDVLGRVIPKSKRGQLTGWAASISGFIAIGSSLFFLLLGEASAPKELYAGFLFMAATLWWMAAAVHSRVVEFPGEKDTAAGAGNKTFKNLNLLKEDRDFRNFVITRTLAIGSGLSTPFIITLAHQRLNGDSIWLGVFIAVEGVAAMLSAPFWGHWADRSSRLVLRISMAAVAVLLFLSVVLSLSSPGELADRILFPLIFFLLGMAHTGVRVGRKTYIVDMAEGNERTEYVSVANTLIGIFLLIAGVLTGLFAIISVNLTLSIFAICALLGALFGSKLKDVSK